MDKLDDLPSRNTKMTDDELSILQKYFTDLSNDRKNIETENFSYQPLRSPYFKGLVIVMIFFALSLPFIDKLISLIPTEYVKSTYGALAFKTLVFSVSLFIVYKFV